MPQPASSIPENQVIIYHGNGGQSVMRDRPDIAVAISDVIAAWGGLEMALSKTYSVLLGVRQLLAADIFYSLQSAGPKDAALRAIASRRLRKSPRQRRAFIAIMEQVGRAQKQRDRIAHWVYGTILKMPPPGGETVIPVTDRIALADPRYFTNRTKRAYIYTITDIEQISAQINGCAAYLSTFTMALQSEGGARRKLFQKLYSEPHLIASLVRQEGILQPHD